MHCSITANPFWSWSEHCLNGCSSRPVEYVTPQQAAPNAAIPSKRLSLHTCITSAGLRCTLHIFTPSHRNLRFTVPRPYSMIRPDRPPAAMVANARECSTQLTARHPLLAWLEMLVIQVRHTRLQDAGHSPVACNPRTAMKKRTLKCDFQFVLF